MCNRKIVAVIPVRKGSQRVKNKNLRPFADTTLLDNKLKILMAVSQLDEIIVNTDSNSAIELIETKYTGTKIKAQLRNSYYASSNCSGSEFFKHLGDVTETDIFVYTPCTSPFIKPETISLCIEKYLYDINHTKFDSVSTVSVIKDFLWLNGKALNYNPQNAPNSQDLPNVMALNFGTTVISRNDLIKNQNIIGKNPDFIITDGIETIDIDTPLDFKIAEILYQTITSNTNLIKM